MFMHAGSVTLVLSESLQPNGLYPKKLLCPWDSSVQYIYNDRERKMNAVIPKEHMKTHCNWEEAKGKEDPFTSGERQKNSWC